MKKTYPTPAESERDWALVAAAVLRGDYDGAKGSEVKALLTGLRGYSSADCVAAVKKLDPKGKFNKEKEETE